MEDLGIWEMLLIILGPTGGVWLSAKVALNGTREDVRGVKESLREFRQQAKEDMAEVRAGQQKNREAIVRLQEQIGKGVTQ